MRSLARLFSAFLTVADSLLSLASLLDDATARLRQQLDGPAAPESPQLRREPLILDNGEPAKKNGRKTS